MKKGLIFLLFVVVLLAGCSALYSKFKGPTQEKQLPRGIAINFIDGFPPNKIVEGQQFNVKTNIINYGAKSTGVDVGLSDSIGESYAGVPGDESDSVPLEGNEGLSQAGFDSQEVSFGPYRYDNVEEGMSATFIATASFKYDYKSAAILCVNGYNSKIKKCKDSEIITGSLLGLDALKSPIAVTKIGKSSSVVEDGSASILMDITISNVGSGELEDDELNVDVSSGDFTVECAKKKIQFKNSKEKTITCTATGKVESEFLQSPLVISYDYNYRVTNEYGPVQIVKVERD